MGPGGVGDVVARAVVAAAFLVAALIGGFLVGVFRAMVDDAGADW